MDEEANGVDTSALVRRVEELQRGNIRLSVLLVVISSDPPFLCCYGVVSFLTLASCGYLQNSFQGERCVETIMCRHLTEDIASLT